MSRIVSIVSDLIFRSKIESTARAVGAHVDSVASANALADVLAAEPVDLVIVDMALDRALALDCIARAAESGGPRVLAFFSHVETDLADAARQAGAGEILPRSAFAARLPQLLRGDHRGAVES